MSAAFQVQREENKVVQAAGEDHQQESIRVVLIPLEVVAIAVPTAATAVAGVALE
jgi:hypothetical protein